MESEWTILHSSKMLICVDVVIASSYSVTVNQCFQRTSFMNDNNDVYLNLLSSPVNEILSSLPSNAVRANVFDFDFTFDADDVDVTNNLSSSAV